MGTRSITLVQGKIAGNSETETYATIYRQFDGYPSGMGEDMKAALAGREVVNGFQDRSTQLNGPGCVAAFLVGKLKGGECGNVYLYPAGSSGCGEEFVYTLSVEPGKPINMKIESAYDSNPIYDGPIADFDSDEIEDDE